jgi:alpha-N-arabinofuranosidase
MERSILPLLTIIAVAVLCPALATAQSRAPFAASIRVDGSRITGRVGDYVFGHFVEFMYTCVNGGLWAEALRDTGFENADDNGDGMSDPWVPGPSGRYAIDAEWAYPEPGDLSRSQRIEADAEEVAAIVQSPVAVRQGDPLTLSLHLRGQNAGAVTARLRDAAGDVIATARISEVTGEWRRFAAVLAPSSSDDNASLEIALGGPGTLSIDRVSLMPGSAVRGYRADVISAVRALKPSVIRFPGGNFAQCYHWEDGVGPRDLRPTTINYAWSRWLEPNDVGIDEFVDLCREVGAEPLICVNIGDTGSRNRIPNNDSTRALRDAVHWLEYCNGAADTPYGRIRARNGHPEPYNIRLWEIGNEIYGDWEIGHVDAEAYARKFLRFATALRRQDPRVQILACGADEAWNRTLLQTAGAEIDWLVLHLYYRSDSFADLTAQPRNYGRVLDDARRLTAGLVPGRDIKISLNEWNCPLGKPGAHSLKAGLFAASLLHEVMRRDFVPMSNCSDLVNGWEGGLIQADHARLFVTPTYRAIELLSNNHGPTRLAAEVDCPTFDTPSQGAGHPLLDVIATRDAGATRLYVSVINKSPDQAARAELSFAGAGIVPGPADARVLTAPTIDTYNDRDHRDAVAIRDEQLQVGPVFAHVFPPASVTVITIPLQK